MKKTGALEGSVERGKKREGQKIREGRGFKNCKEEGTGLKNLLFIFGKSLRLHLIKKTDDSKKA